MMCWGFPVSVPSIVFGVAPGGQLYSSQASGPRHEDSVEEEYWAGRADGASEWNRGCGHRGESSQPEWCSRPQTLSPPAPAEQLSRGQKRDSQHRTGSGTWSPTGHHTHSCPVFHDSHGRCPSNSAHTHEDVKLDALTLQQSWNWHLWGRPGGQRVIPAGPVSGWGQGLC